MGFTKARSFTLEKGLYLEERKGAKHYKTRALLQGKYHFSNTKTTDYRRAEQIAKSWFRDLQRQNEGKSASGAVWGAAKDFLASLDPGKRLSHQKKWMVIRDFFSAMDVADVSSKVLNDFIKWRKSARTVEGAPLTNSTIHKDIVTIRQILKFATREGLIDRLPYFPPVGKITPNPRPWLELHEWKAVQAMARARMEEPDLNPRTRRQREDLYDFIMMMVHSCARVGELQNLRVLDCQIREGEAKVGKPKRPYLFMHIRGKTGERDSVAWSGAVTAFQRLVDRKKLQPADHLFSEHHRDGFRELLIAANLRSDNAGRMRNLKSLRSTALMQRILQNPKVSLKLLADNAGTSVAMLDKFYLKALSVKLNVAELV